jgi:hypothetical protein
MRRRSLRLGLHATIVTTRREVRKAFALCFVLTVWQLAAIHRPLKEEELAVISRTGHAEPPVPLTLDERRMFLKLPLEERRRRFAEQADRLIKQYETEDKQRERLAWQAGDIVEY